MTKILWNGTSLAQSRREGYKDAEDQILANIKTKGIQIDHTCLIPSDVQNLNSAGIGLQYESTGSTVDCDILINNRLPSDYSFCSGYNIGFSYWETTRLPSNWVDNMNKMDEVWTTSEWAKQTFIESGVKVPVYNFRLGVDSNLYYPQLRKDPHRPFTFLSIGSPSTRKNSQIAVDAFLKLFNGFDNFLLLYKSVDAPDARIYENGNLKSLYDHPNILVVDSEITSEDLSYLYNRVDCVLYPTSGEGWGLLPFQSIAKGIPTICTNATACTEYAEMSVPLNFKMGQSKMSGIYEGCGEWAEPDFDDLCDKMLYVVSDYSEIAEKTYNNAMKKYQEMTWDSAAEDYGQRLWQILKEQKHKL